MATGRAVDQAPCGNEMTNAFDTANIKIATTPSISSRRVGIWRTTSATPTSNGATVTMPNKQEANQNRHTMKGDVIG